jgi:Domain of unknown function (DUF4172)
MKVCDLANQLVSGLLRIGLVSQIDLVCVRRACPEIHGHPRRGRVAAVGRLIGRMERLGFTLRAEATLQTRTEEVLKSGEIEDEILDRDQVRSSVARRLGMDIGALTPADRPR